MEDKITITIEEYKELLDYKYKWLNHECKTITIKEPYNPVYNPPIPYYGTRTIDPILEPPYKITCDCNKKEYVGVNKCIKQKILI